MNLINKVFLTFNATSWVIVIFCIKNDFAVFPFTPIVSSIILLLVPIASSAISIPFTLFLGKDSLKTCSELEEANSSFLPTYLGYFFVGLGIEKVQHLIIIYLIIFMFTFVAQTKYFNPIYFLFGYNFYSAETTKGTKVFLIVRENFRRAKDVKFENLRRINDTTYISWKEK